MTTNPEVESPWKGFHSPTGLIREALAVLKPPTPAEELLAVAAQLDTLAAQLRALAREMA